MVGLLAVAAPAALLSSIAWVKDPKQVTLILNIACPLMLGLIAYALWRSSARWVTPEVTALYTVMLALSTAALIVGIWFQGVELSHYDWQFSKTRVKAGKPPTVYIPALPPPTAIKDLMEPAPAKDSAEPAPAKSSVEAAPGKDSAEPAPAKGTAEAAPAKDSVAPAPAKNTAEPAPAKDSVAPAAK
jgi:hypothetical protein